MNTYVYYEKQQQVKDNVYNDNNSRRFCHSLMSLKACVVLKQWPT